MKVFHYSEIGSHDENEDALDVVPHAADSSALICALADGQGGQPGGAAAAQHSVSSCLANAQLFAPRDLLNPFTWVEIGEYVDQTVLHAPEAGYTTFIGLYVTPSFVVGASCGDSAIALLTGGQFLLLTENQYKNPPVGSGAARLTPFAAELNGTWKLLVMSDGVWKYAGWDSISKRGLSETGEMLISNLRNDVVVNSKVVVDDFTVILIEP